jgi:hypothetical protein
MAKIGFPKLKKNGIPMKGAIIGSKTNKKRINPIITLTKLPDIICRIRISEDENCGYWGCDA